MPSPFPGMDPYLEDPDICPNLYHNLSTCIQAELQPLLPYPFFAATNFRVWYESPEEEVREAYVEIRTRQERGETLFTIIELLSRANKTPGSHGRELYLRKQREVRASETNLIEIDLLRAGMHTTAVPRQFLDKQIEHFDFHVSVWRHSDPGEFHVYPIRLEQILPKVAVALSHDAPPVLLDLQAAFNRAYDAGPFRRRIHYDRDRIIPPLTPEQTAWANDLLRRQGLLPT